MNERASNLGGQNLRRLVARNCVLGDVDVARERLGNVFGPVFIVLAFDVGRVGRVDLTVGFVDVELLGLSEDRRTDLHLARTPVVSSRLQRLSLEHRDRDDMVSVRLPRDVRRLLRAKQRIRGLAD